MIPLYIFGLLLRFGPQHGYQIKKLIEEQLADFTQIKLPTIYYHLEKMEASGLLFSQIDQEGARPEKKVYHISEKGNSAFQTLLHQELNIQYRPNFNVDAVFYFSDHLSQQEIIDSIKNHLEKLRKSLEQINEHRACTMPYLPNEMRPFAEIIFEHHTLHYQAEITWAERSMKVLKGEI